MSFFNPFAPARHSGHSPRFNSYAYRRETRAHIDPNENPYSANPEINSEYGLTPEQILSITPKIRYKEGIVFKHSPMFQQLKDSDVDVPRTINPAKFDSLITKKDLSKNEKEQTKNDKEDKKTRKEEHDPTPNQIRVHLKKIVKFHKKQVDETFPCIYPLAGCLGGDSDNDNNGSSDSDTSNSKHSSLSTNSNNLGISKKSLLSVPRRPPKYSSVPFNKASTTKKSRKRSANPNPSSSNSTRRKKQKRG